MMVKIKLERYRWWHSLSFFFGLLDIQALKFAGVFKKKFIKKFIKSIFSESKEKLWKFTIFSNRKIIGGLDIAEVSKGVFNIGIIVFKKYRKNNFATSAIRKAFGIAKKKGAKKIVGRICKDNLPSIRLVQKLGYKKTKTINKEFFWEKKL